MFEAKRPLDPEIRDFLDAALSSVARQPDLSAVSIEEARRVAKDMRMPWSIGGPAAAAVATHRVPARSGAVSVRIYYPHRNKPQPAMVYLHGGGWTLFDLDTHDRLMREYAVRADVAVVGVDFALAPETTFPGQVDECTDVILWLAREGEKWGIDPHRLAIAGDSAGANLAMAVLLVLRDSGGPALKAGALNYGVYDCDLDRPSYREYGDGSYWLSTERMAWFWSNYVPDPADRLQPLVSPLRAELSGLPPLFLAISESDVLHDENVEMATRLRNAGNDVDARIYPGTIHAFIEAVSVAAVAERALEDQAKWLRGHLASRGDRLGRDKGEKPPFHPLADFGRREKARVGTEGR